MGNSMFGSFMWAGHSLWMLVVAVIVVIPAWRICQRMGFPGWFGVLILVPVVNILLLYFIAFNDWPGGGSNEGDPDEP